MIEWAVVESETIVVALAQLTMNHSVGSWVFGEVKRLPEAEQEQLAFLIVFEEQIEQEAAFVGCPKESARRAFVD